MPDIVGDCFLKRKLLKIACTYQIFMHSHFLPPLHTTSRVLLGKVKVEDEGFRKKFQHEDRKSSF